MNYILQGLVLHAKQSLANKEIKELEDKFDLIPERTRPLLSFVLFSAFSALIDPHLGLN